MTATGRATTTATAAAHLHGVRKRFGSGRAAVEVLRGVDLVVNADEVLLLVGPSGCGKTTLLSVLAGVLDPDEGDLRVLGQRIGRLGEDERAAFRARRIGFVFQDFNLVHALTARENVSVPAVLAGVPRGAALRRADEWLDRVGMADHRHVHPGRLSGGQQQRVAIARGLVHDPDLVVCDEPTSALDEENGQRVMELLRLGAYRPGRSVIIVTHDARTFAFADRIAHMADGRIARIAQPGEES